jgi:hypothetical protein
MARVLSCEKPAKKGRIWHANVPRSIVCAIARKIDSRATSARSARRAGRATRDASSGIARDATIIDCIVDDTTTTVTTIAIVAAVDADSDKRNENATIKKKSDRVATDERGKRREGNDRRATTSKKTWARRDERRRDEKSGRDDQGRRLRDEA